MDWFTSTDSDLAVLEDSTLDDYTDGIPDSYDLTQWYGSQDYFESALLRRTTQLMSAIS